MATVDENRDKLLRPSKVIHTPEECRRHIEGPNREEIATLNQETRDLEADLTSLRNERERTDTRYAEQIEELKGMIRQNYSDGAEWPH